MTSLPHPVSTSENGYVSMMNRLCYGAPIHRGKNPFVIIIWYNTSLPFSSENQIRRSIPLNVQN